MKARARAASCALAGALALVFGGCRLSRFLEALERPTDAFIASREDARVLYEPGAERQARTVVAALPAALAHVAARQFQPFAVPVRIYVCASIGTFTSFGASPRAGGFTLNDRVFVSPKPENTSARLPGVLAHELSHLNLMQHLGLVTQAELPPWFTEGLAVEVSQGGGAEDVSEAEAWAAIAAGRTFVPEAVVPLEHRRAATDFGLAAHLFYRQAGMFVAYLRAQDGARFERFLGALEHDGELALDFEAAYGEGLESAWQRFRARAERMAPRHDPLRAEPRGP